MLRIRAAWGRRTGGTSDAFRHLAGIVAAVSVGAAALPWLGGATPMAEPARPFAAAVAGGERPQRMTTARPAASDSLTVVFVPAEPEPDMRAIDWLEHDRQQMGLSALRIIVHAPPSPFSEPGALGESVAADALDALRHGLGEDASPCAGPACHAPAG
jgi:hypothetical protein